jgi:hypothetical protein
VGPILDSRVHVYVEQRLLRCDRCDRPLALRYRWEGRIPPDERDERIGVHGFHCPVCGYPNIVITFLYAYAFEVMAIPGGRPRGWDRRLQRRAASPSFTITSRPHASSSPVPTPYDSLRRIEILLPYFVWCLYCLSS